MAQSKQPEASDVTDEIMGHRATKAEAAGKQPLIPDGIYNNCTVNVKGARRFTNEDGGTVTKVNFQFSCPDTEADLSTSLKFSFGAKAPFGKLFRACFPGQEVEGKEVRELNGKRVNMVVGNDNMNGNDYNTFTFLPVVAAAPAKK
jgi:hypothetical protein